MNYRHIYHAGNACDVVKHAVLAVLIEKLRSGEKPFGLLDTHAGIGLYDLHDERSLKTAEAAQGIRRYLAAPPIPELAAYDAVLQSFNPGWRRDDPSTLEPFRFYPGSPLLASRLARPEDRITACELHPEDAETLKRAARDFGNITVHSRDGFEALRALLPPAEKRGAVLIDPPYEKTDEFDRLIDAVTVIHKRWAQGIVAIWYPVKDRPALWRFHENLIATRIPNMLCAEFVYEQETRHDRLNGCGLIFINPPWKFDEKLSVLFPALHVALGSAHHGVMVKWLVGDDGRPVA